MVEELTAADGQSDWSTLVQRHHKFLLDHIDPDFGLLTKLVTMGILSYKQRDIVKAETTVDDRNEKLLNIIRSEDKWDELIEALRSSNQTHVLNYLEADGDYCTGVDWTLGEREEKLLRVNHEKLIDLIQSSDLIAKLHSMDIINKSQRDFIRGKQTSSDQNEAFLNILRRRSIGDYNKTIYCLKKTKQPHVAQLLEEGGAVVELHVETDGDREEEEEIADIITDFLGNKSVEQCGRILELAQSKVIAAKRGCSVVLYIHLQTMKQLKQLKLSLQFGSIIDRMQRLFNRITSALRQVTVLNVRITEDDELSRVEDILQVGDVCEVNTAKRPYPADDQDEENSSADSPLWDTYTRSKASCDEIHVHVLLEMILRHKNFLAEIVDSDLEFLKKLLSKGTFSRNEARSLIGKQVYGERNAELLRYITDQKKCDSFVELLRKTGQTHVVNYLIGDGIFKDEFGSDWPLTINQMQKLNHSRAFLVDLININDLLEELCSCNIINASRRRLIESGPNSVKKNEIFLQILQRMSQKNFRHAMKCFCETNQAFVPQVLDEDGAGKAEVTVPITQATKDELAVADNPATTICERMNASIKVEMLARHKTFLAEVVDSCSRVMDKLLSKGTLTRRQIRCLKRRPTLQKRNFKLLEFIMDQEKCDSFIDSLRNTRQTHVINYLVGDGEYSVEFKSDWPLTDTQLQNLNDNEEFFVDLIDTKELLPKLRKLFFRDVINIRHIELLYSHESSFETNEVFLNILRRLNQLDFRRTINCLCEGKQNHLAENLDKNGVFLKIRVDTNATIEDEDNFVDQITQQLRNSGSFEELGQFNVIAAKTNGSIVLYLYCQKLQEFEHLQMSLKCGQLKDSVGHLFKRLLKPAKGVNVTRITFVDEDSELRFLELTKRCYNSNFSQHDKCLLAKERTLEHLPPDILEMIFQQCYLLSIRNSESKNLRDRNIIEILITVNFFWFRELSRGRCRKTVFRRLAAHFQRLSNSYTAVQNNRQYLMEFIQPSDELLGSLELAEYLTNEQAATIKKLRNSRDKTFEILHLLKQFDSQKIDILVRCLRQTKQRRIAFIIENGGAVLKATAQDNSAVKQMIESLNDHLSQRDPSSKTVKMIDDDYRENHVHRRKKMQEVWIWFQEQKAFETMRTHLLQAQSVSSIDYAVVEENRDSVFPVIASSVNLNSKQFEKKFVSLSIIAEVTGRIECDQHIHRLTKLKDKIYVACSNAEVIYVYDDRNQFSLHTQIKMRGISVAAMASCEKQNCLYVTDFRNDCIHRITEGESTYEQKNHEIIEWLKPDKFFVSKSISVTSDGEVLIFNRGDLLIYYILIYNSDAELRLSIPLPVEIVFLRQALKTSNGDFMILHMAKKGNDTGSANRTSKLELRQRKETNKMKEIEMNAPVDETLAAVGERVKENDHINESLDNHELRAEERFADIKIVGITGEVIGQYIPQNEEQKFGHIENITIDSDDRVFVPDYQNHRVILVDPDLQWDRILISTEQNSQHRSRIYPMPSRLFWDENKKQLIVEGFENTKVANVYTLNRR